MFLRKRVLIAGFSALTLVGAVFGTTTSASAAGPTGSCPSGWDQSGSRVLKDGKAEGPAKLRLYWNDGRTKVCIRVDHTGASKGHTTATMAMINGVGAAKKDSGSFAEYAGPLTVSVKKCVAVEGSIKWKGKTYSAKDSSVCAPAKSKKTKKTKSAIDKRFDKIAKCESGDRNIVSKNGHYGYFQFKPETWWGIGGKGLPTDHSREVQLKFAKKLQKKYGWGQWSCA